MGLFEYINETQGEMRHVSWPTRKQTIMFTVLVLVISLVVAVYLGVIDFLFKYQVLGPVVGSDVILEAPIDTTSVTPAPTGTSEDTEAPILDIDVSGSEVEPEVTSEFSL